MGEGAGGGKEQSQRCCTQRNDQPGFNPLEHAVFDSRNERNIINLGVHLDEQAFKQASQKMHDFIEFFDQLQAESLERVSDPGELIPTSASLLMYESAKGKKPEGGSSAP